MAKNDASTVIAFDKLIATAPIFRKKQAIPSRMLRVNVNSKVK
jgi:hypothetical protein